MTAIAIPAEVLPPLYGTWLAGLLAAPIPPERRATCASCAMVAVAGEPPPQHSFAADLKCCTYTPELANFVVGRILADREPETAGARGWLEARIASGVAVTPLGLYRSPIEQRVHAVVGDAPGAFGNFAEARCPHFRRDGGGTCGIWRYREAVCSTWYCKHERGLIGRAFWSAVRTLLCHVERALGTWAFLELEPGAEACEAILLHAQRHTADRLQLEQLAPEVYRSLWGPWAGRELELFVEAGRRVSALTWADVERIGGPDVRLLAEVIRRRHRDLTADALPAGLRRADNALVQISPTPGRVRVMPQSFPYDFTDVPAGAPAAAEAFAGRPAAEAAAALGPEVVRALLDYGFLAPG